MNFNIDPMTNAVIVMVFVVIMLLVLSFLAEMSARKAKPHHKHV